MKLRYFAILICVLLASIFSCKNDPVSPFHNQGTVKWDQITILQTYYDSLYIGSNNQILVNNKSVDKIILLGSEGADYLSQDTLKPTYTPIDGNYYLNFEFHKQMPEKIVYFHFKLIFTSETEKIIELDSNHTMIKYPYNSAEVFITADQLFPEYEITLQDIDFNDDYVFFHPAGPLGLYQYNLVTGLTQGLGDYPGGDFIAQDSLYAFMDVNHWEIYRYNLERDTIDLKFDLSFLQYNELSGIECYNGHVYAIMNDFSGENYIAIFDYDGNFIGSLPYLDGLSFLTIYNGIAYSHDFNSELLRYDLASESFLPALRAPSYNGGGIRIYRDRFYYVDWDKRIIAYIPLTDIL